MTFWRTGHLTVKNRKIWRIKNRVLFNFIARVCYFFFRAAFFLCANKGFRCVTSNRIKCSPYGPRVLILHNSSFWFLGFFFDKKFYFLYTKFWFYWSYLDACLLFYFIFCRVLHVKHDIWPEDACELEKKTYFILYILMSQTIFFFLVYFSNFISARHRQRKYKYLQLETDQRIIIEFSVNKLGVR